MKLYSSIDNFVVPRGIRFPHRPADGRLFYRTDIEELFIHVDSKWTSIRSGVLDLSVIAEQVRLQTLNKFASIDTQIKTISKQITETKQPLPVVVSTPNEVQLKITNVFEKGQRVVGGII